MRTDKSIVTENHILVPLDICRHADLCSLEKLVYGVLLAHPAATVREIADILGSRETEIRRSLKRLEAVGLRDTSKEEHA